MIRIKNLNKKRKTILFFMSIIFTIYFFNLYNKSKFKKDEILYKENIVMEIEKTYNNQSFDKKNIGEITKLINKTDKDTQYYFILGYIDYINKDYKSASKNFEQAKNKILETNSSFIKIYTYILLNKSLIHENKYDDLIENCKMAFKQIGRDKKYKNDNKIIWDNISTLIKNKDTINSSINILNTYLQETRDLNDECKINLIRNLGFLYSLDYRYSESIYQYLHLIKILDSNKNIRNINIHKSKVFTNIGDINYILGDYQMAIQYYDKAIGLEIENKTENAMTKSMAYINKISSYIEINKYDEAINLSKKIYSLLDYIDKDSRDDIEMLIYNNLALAYIYKHDFNKAQQLLNKSLELLKNDKIEFSLNKEVFINISYAEFYKEQNKYDKSLDIFNYTLQQSTQNGLGLEMHIYKSIIEIYKNKNDLDNYIKYNKALMDERDKLEIQFKKDYMKYATQLYERDELKSKEQQRKINMLILIFSIIILLLILISRMKVIKLLKKSNFIDGMTNLYNRKYLDYYIEKNKKNFDHKKVSIILIDIDYFKKYNDNYGHIKGDEIIKEVSNSLKNSIKDQGIVIRYGGEEMVLILPEVSIDNAKVIAEKIQESIRGKQIEHKYSEICDILTVSIGIYTNEFSQNEGIYKMIDNADKALYGAKNKGRNRYEVFYD
ncbi:diguanylate kinase signaling protein [[Clostridium] sordellii]|uniref:tetratricopeptide repeat-containing diguanylate cyclase n=1 Tax=Paraclostridium sordellii TaxID=1505 RepID=UPI0005DC4FA6|nr:tetratricopeptide repeat-containing diguanylate cyclase [Paeniclostridium sordellii]MCH1966743.1 diguanylate cyclase [Paeniclostridium sordellii]CEQ09878.1 diguanylate kinase signaling protein [[Clostridium] sordellii] [Paeniclostridium sordellii]